MSIHSCDRDCNAKRLGRDLGAWRTRIQGHLRAFREVVSMKYKTEVGPDHVLIGLDGTTLCMGCKQFPSEGNREDALSFYPGQGLHWRSCAVWRSVLGTNCVLTVRGTRQQRARSRNQQFNKRMSGKAADVRKECTCDRTFWTSTDVLQDAQAVLYWTTHRGVPSKN